MKYDFDAFERPLAIVRIDEIAFDEFDASELRNVLAVARAEIVEHAHPIAALDQRLGDVRTNETGAAGN